MYTTGLKEQRFQILNGFQHSGWSLTKKIDRYAKILDVGCGKGSAIRVFLKFKFNKIDGVDLSEFLINTAKNNFTKLNITKPQFYCSNILDFKNFDDYNYFYLFLF